MSAGRYDTVIEQGATFERIIDWIDYVGDGINLTGYSVSGKVKLRTSDRVALASFTITPADQTTYPGRFTISLSSAQTAGFPSRYSSDGRKECLNLYYDIEASMSGTVYRILEGILAESPEINR